MKRQRPQKAMLNILSQEVFRLKFTEEYKELLAHAAHTIIATRPLPDIHTLRAAHCLLGYLGKQT